MKRLIKMSLIVIFVMVFYSYTADSSDVNPAAKLFKATGGDVIDIQVNGSCEINTRQTTEGLVVGLFKAAELEGTYRIKNYDRKTELQFENENYKGRIFTSKLTGKNAIYASFALSQQCNIENINIIRRYVLKAFKEFKAEPSFSTLIRGKFNGYLDGARMEKVILTAVSRSRGKLEDKVAEDNMVSVCGYIPGIDEKLKYRDGYINMNMALRYSKSDNCTYIWLGTPVIYEEY